MTTSSIHTLVVAEHNNKTLNETTARTITAGKALGDVDLLLVGFNLEALSQEAAKFEGISKVITADHEAFQHILPENTAKLIAKIGKAYHHILAPASTLGKNLMPRVAALLDVAQISDIVKIESDDIFIRPIYAGNAMATVQSKEPIKILTVRTSAFNAAKMGENGVKIKSLANEIDKDAIENRSSTFVRQELTKSERPELGSARVVISGGRGLQSGENFKLLETLADHLNGSIGASRAAVDAGYVPNDYQVGQTGKIVAPELYIAIGISGAIQHLAGMKESKVIVAINKDEDAPIFDVADYGMVGDLFDIVPKLNEALNKTLI